MKIVNELTTFEYKGSKVTFRYGENVMMNANEMARVFGKQVSEWLRLTSTKEYLIALEKSLQKADRQKSQNMGNAHILIESKRGVNGGTWMHEDAAIEFARWLSPEFSVWCNQRIKELMRYGITATPQTIDTILADPDNAIRLLTALKEERTKNAELIEMNKEQARQIEEAKPAVFFASAVENCDTLILIREMAKILKQNGVKTGGERFREQLKQDGYLTQKGEPTQRSMELGIMRVVENTVTTPSGTFASLTTKVTGKGQSYFLNKYAGGGTQSALSL